MVFALASHARRTGAALALVAAVGAGHPAGAAELTHLKMSLAFTLDASSATYIYAEHEGMLAKAGYDIQMDASRGSGDSISRVASGAYDMGIADLSPLIQFAAANPGKAPRAVFVVQDLAQYAVMANKKAGIEKPQDLIGKTVGGGTGEAAFEIFPLFAQKAGLDLSKIDLKRVDVRLRETMFMHGDFPAVAGFDATLWLNAKALGMKRDQITMINYGDYGLKLYGASVLVSQDFLKRDPAGVKKIVAVFNAAWLATIKDPGRVAQDLSSADPMLHLDLETERLKEIVDGHVDTAGSRKNGLGTVDPQRLQDQIDTVAAAFKLPRKPSANEIYTGKFLPPLDARTIR
jgi:NitT/TauT family transport system substrate-binding protein